MHQRLFGAGSLTALLTLLLTARGISAHGIQSDADRDHTGMTWAQIHMLEEHHIGNFDPTSFFHLHDFDNSQTWTANEILRTYGIDPNNPSLINEDKPIPMAKRGEVVKTILDAMDYDGDGGVTLDEFLHFHREGGVLPDFGLGTGQHGDDEYEYELHHYEKYHSEDGPETALDHPEDIDHFKKHAQLEAEQEKQARLEKMSIVLENIPMKFRRTK